LVLLWFPLRDRFSDKIINHQPTHRDLLRRLLHSVLPVSLPLLVLNVLYFTSIVQTGLSPVSILSLLNGIVSVPVLLLLALRSWLQLRQERLAPLQPPSTSASASESAAESPSSAAPTDSDRKPPVSSDWANLIVGEDGSISAEISVSDIMLGDWVAHDDTQADDSSSASSASSTTSTSSSSPSTTSSTSPSSPPLQPTSSETPVLLSS
jgi:hypothetical protein